THETYEKPQVNNLTSNQTPKKRLTTQIVSSRPRYSPKSFPQPKFVNSQPSHVKRGSETSFFQELHKNDQVRLSGTPSQSSGPKQPMKNITNNNNIEQQHRPPQRRPTQLETTTHNHYA